MHCFRQPVLLVREFRYLVHLLRCDSLATQQGCSNAGWRKAESRRRALGTHTSRRQRSSAWDLSTPSRGRPESRSRRHLWRRCLTRRSTSRTPTSGSQSQMVCPNSSYAFPALYAPVFHGSAAIWGVSLHQAARFVPPSCWEVLSQLPGCRPAEQQAGS